MIKTNLLITLLLVTAFCHAQVKEGTITYAHKINMHKRIINGHDKLLAKIPKYELSTYTLYFNENQSVYTKATAASEEISRDPSGQGFTKKVGGITERIFYLNTQSNDMIEKRGLEEVQYLIEGKAPSLQWQLTQGDKEILGFHCKKAITKIDNKEIVAWYAPSIPVASGPEVYQGLKGLILQVDINGGIDEIVIAAVSFEKSVDPHQLKMPSGGEKISRKNFEAILQKYIQETESDVPRIDPNGNMKIAN